MSEPNVLTEADKETADIRVNEMDENAGEEFESLFDDEVVSDAELKGEDLTDEETEPATSGSSNEPETKPADEEKPETQSEEKAEPAKEVEEKAEPPEEPDYSQAPPKGYVPIPALQEARLENKTLKDNIQMLQQRIEDAKVPEKEALPPELEGFKVLSNSEFDELVEEDVEEATKYNNRLQQYNEHQRVVQTRQHNELIKKERVDSIINASVQKIVEAVPGIYDEGNPVGNELFEFAKSNGLDERFIGALTAPGTRILVPNESGNLSEPVPLGDGAASMVAMIHKLYNDSKSNDPDSVRSEVEETIRKDEREKVTKELLNKFQNDTGQSFRSISDAPGGSDEDLSTNKTYTEADFSKMSPEEERRVLSGM